MAGSPIFVHRRPSRELHLEFIPDPFFGKSQCSCVVATSGHQHIPILDAVAVMKPKKVKWLRAIADHIDAPGLLHQSIQSVADALSGRVVSGTKACAAKRGQLKLP